MIAVLIVLAGAIGALVAFAVHGGFRRASSGSHAGPRHHGHSEGWTDEQAPDHAFVAVGWMKRCGHLAHPQADRCYLRRRDHPEPQPRSDDAPADDYDDSNKAPVLPQICKGCLFDIREQDGRWLLAWWNSDDDDDDGDPADCYGGRGHEPITSEAGCPAHSQPDLTIRPFDGELTADRMERIRRGLREALRQADPPDEFMGAPVAEPWIGVPVGDILVEPTLPPLPSFTPVWEPRPCRDVAEASVWTPPADPDLREFVDARMAGPSRSALGSWVDDVLAGPQGLGYLQPFWRDGGWTA